MIGRIGGRAVGGWLYGCLGRYRLVFRLPGEGGTSTGTCSIRSCLVFTFSDTVACESNLLMHDTFPGLKRLVTDRYCHQGLSFAMYSTGSDVVRRISNKPLTPNKNSSALTKWLIRDAL